MGLGQNLACDLPEVLLKVWRKLGHFLIRGFDVAGLYKMKKKKNEFTLWYLRFWTSAL